MSSDSGTQLQGFFPLPNASDAGNITGTTIAYLNGMENTTVKSAKDPLITLTVPAIMFASGVFGNLLAIFVLLRSSREHKQTVFYRLVGALACTDLFGTCATSPITLAVYANNLKWVGGDALCNYESLMLIFAGNATIFIVGAMAVDRFIAICYPFFYDEHITVARAKYGIIGLWALALFMGCLPIMGLGENILQFPGTWCFFTFTSDKLKNQIFVYGYSTMALFVVGLTAVANVFVTSVLLKMRRKALRTMNLCNTKRNDSELQMMVLLLGIIIIFSTCWCPFMIRLIINQINQRQVDVKADLHALRLASLNQILDPWIYILFRKEMFNKALRFVKDHVFKRCNCVFGNFQNRRTNRVIINGKPFDDGEINNKTNEAEMYENTYALIKKENGENQSTEHASETDKYNKRISMVSRNSSRKSGQSKSPTDESIQLREEAGRALPPLELKHSSCLFCFANHSKHVIKSISFESKSMNNIHSADECQNEHSENECKENCNGSKICTLNDKTIKDDENVARDVTHQHCSLSNECDKRNSIHLSLTDLTLNERRLY